MRQNINIRGSNMYMLYRNKSPTQSLQNIYYHVLFYRIKIDTKHDKLIQGIQIWVLSINAKIALSYEFNKERNNYAR